MSAVEISVIASDVCVSSVLGVGGMLTIEASWLVGSNCGSWKRISICCKPFCISVVVVNVEASRAIVVVSVVDVDGNDFVTTYFVVTYHTKCITGIYQTAHDKRTVRN